MTTLLFGILAVRIAVVISANNEWKQALGNSMIFSSACALGAVGTMTDNGNPLLTSLLLVGAGFFSGGGAYAVHDLWLDERRYA